MELTLTPERIFEAAPIPGDRRKELELLLSTAPTRDTEAFVRLETWSFISKWYKHEEKRIGEKRAFLGVVYRLLDDPTGFAPFTRTAPSGGSAMSDGGSTPALE
jgi:hypothetical protein